MATLAYCGHVKRKAAEILGVSLKTLYNRLETYNGKEARRGDKDEPASRAGLPARKRRRAETGRLGCVAAASDDSYSPLRCSSRCRHPYLPHRSARRSRSLRCVAHGIAMSPCRPYESQS